MKKRNIYWFVAGILNLFTALLHIIAGQYDLVNPLMESSLTDQIKAEWFGLWHMVTILLFATSYIILKNARRNIADRQTESMRYLGILYILVSIPFIVSSIVHQLLAPQWILLLPIGLLVYIGQLRHNSTSR